jgi:hypothetical protein
LSPTGTNESEPPGGDPHLDDGTRDPPAFALAAMAGLRAGELKGLLVDDVVLGDDGNPLPDRHRSRRVGRHRRTQGGEASAGGRWARGPDIRCAAPARRRAVCDARGRGRAGLPVSCPAKARRGPASGLAARLTLTSDPAKVRAYLGALAAPVRSAFDPSEGPSTRTGSSIGRRPSTASRRLNAGLGGVTAPELTTASPGAVSRPAATARWPHPRRG